MRDARFVADLLQVVHDVVRVLLQRVVDRGVEVGLAAVVVDAQAAAAVEVAHVGAQGGQLHEDAAALAQRVLDGADVGDLGADVHRHAPDLEGGVRRPLRIAPGVVSTLRMPWEGEGRLTDQLQPPGIAFHVYDDSGLLTTHYRVVV